MIKLKGGGYQPARSVHSRGMRVLGEEMERHFAGQCALDLTDDITRSGHRAADLISMTERGELDLCYFSASYLAERVPDLLAFDLPFQDFERGEIFQQLDGALGEHLAHAVAATTGLHVAAFWDNGIRHISNRIWPITTPEDCRGLKIRTLDNAIHRRSFAALGCEPKTIDVRDFRAALASGEVDAQENPLTNYVTFDLYEMQPFLSLTSHIFGLCLLLFNRARYEELPADVRTGLIECAGAATAAQRGFAVQEDIDGLAAIEARGIDIVPAEAIDRAAFRAAVAGVVDEVKPRIDPFVRARLNLAS